MNEQCDFSEVNEGVNVMHDAEEWYSLRGVRKGLSEKVMFKLRLVTRMTPGTKQNIPEEETASGRRNLG